MELISADKSLGSGLSSRDRWGGSGERLEGSEVGPISRVPVVSVC